MNIKKTILYALLFSTITAFSYALNIKEVEKENTNTIAIQPFIGFPKAEVKMVKKAIQNYYKKEVVILSEKAIYKNCFINVKSPRYRADRIIYNLRSEKIDSILLVVGLTHFDISTSKKDNWGNVKQPESKYYDWGIFGLGYRPGSSCVISNYRLKSSNTKRG